MSFGSTGNKHESGDPDYLSPEDLQALSRAEKATVHGLFNEVEILKQKMEKQYAKMSHLVQLYGTLQNQFQDFQIQRIKELNVRVNGGPTEHGPDDRPSTSASDNTSE